jgi:hypothetical protein
MLGQYFYNAYFPQMPEEEAIPMAADLMSATDVGPSATRSTTAAVAVPALQ